MFPFTRLVVLVGLLFCIGAAPAALAQARASDAQVAWRLLDYLAVDYPGAVENGRIKSESEFAEMNEFSGNVRQRFEALPATPAKPALIAGADELKAAIARKASAGEIADRAHKLAAALLAAYPTPVAPKAVPDLQRGAALYAQDCAGCHGMAGDGKGPDAKGLDPPPIAFADLSRARERSLFGLYQVIGQGLDGTAMASFASLPDQDRWDLAFHVGAFAFPASDAAAGAKAFKDDPRARDQVPTLQALTQTTPAQLEAALGRPEALALTAYLRRDPAAVSAPGAGALAVARTRVAQALKAYQAGDRAKAGDLALSGYLDGFETVEPALAAHDSALMHRIESAMGGLRAAISKGAPADEVASREQRIEAMLDAAERALGPGKADAGATFAGAFTILLREGLEALLIVAAMVAFLHKAGREEALPYVHAGWVGALIGGGLTWAAATWLISISGASREFTEGFGSLLAAVVLVSVGVWMHGKSKGDSWQAYVHAKLSHALSRRSAWLLFLLAFVVVYREVFETILFYAALWSQGAHLAMLAGAGTGAAGLAAIAWALLSYSKRLPIGKFFAYSSLLIAVLAVVLAGKGVSALQETGLIDIRPIAGGPSIDLLGLYPTWEGVIVQLLTLAVLVLGFWWTGRKGDAHAEPAAQ